MNNAAARAGRVAEMCVEVIVKVRVIAVKENNITLTLTSLAGIIGSSSEEPIRFGSQASGRAGRLHPICPVLAQRLTGYPLVGSLIDLSCAYVLNHTPGAGGVWGFWRRWGRGRKKIQLPVGRL